MRKLACFLLLCALAFSGCGTTSKKKKKDSEVPESKKEAKNAQESSDVDFQAFVSRLRKAVAARDVNTIASMMTTDFAFVMGKTAETDRKGEGVFQYWDENGLWPELEGILSEKFVKKEEFMVAPPQFANPAVDYDGYRVGIRRVNGSWKFVYFVNG
jgi:predicted component of type VI protein secretion system